MHEAADGGLARVRLPGGLLSADQLRVLAAASVDLGDGQLELTSRANVQIRALQPGAPVELSDRLYAAGLLPSMSHERVRNILASPLSGLDHHSLYDVLAVAGELDRLLCASPPLAALPGRFLFALDDGRGDLAAVKADVAARMVDGRHAELLLAGVATGLHVVGEQLAAVMVEAGEAFLLERAEQQSEAWRLAELEDGPPRVLSRLGLMAGAAAADRPRPEAAGPPSGLLPTDPRPLTTHEPRPEAGLVEQVDGGVALVVTVPLGVLRAEQAEALGEVADEQQLRVTPWRSVVVPGVVDVAAAVERLKGVGLVLDAGSPWNGVTACAGRPGCGKALADVRGDAWRVVPNWTPGTAAKPREAETAGTAKAGRRVHWAGCGRRCGRPAEGFVDVLATEGGYSVDGERAVPVDEVRVR
ncbi:nitrite/sulfite reductase [Kribbella sancticallisti]|uniref:Nitrite/sulfite reductase n=1 Tax=Kribbella sancticallisti TaxID=460087 RepID=A0ABP4MWE1_9ACTN